MKKMFLLLLCLAVAFTFIACKKVVEGPQGEEGPRGPRGIPGEDGEDGITPTISVSDDGYWVINGEKTEYKAVGVDGSHGNDGSTPTIDISEDGYWVINGVKTEYKATNTDKQDSVCEHEYSEYTEYVKASCTYWGVNTGECLKCGYIDYVIVPAVEHTIGDDSKEIFTTVSTCINRRVIKVCEACHMGVEVEVEPTATHLFENNECKICKAPEPCVGLEYALVEDRSSYYVKGIGTCTDTEIIIPSTHDGLPVSEIGVDAFRDQAQITHVIISEGIKKISQRAFLDCVGLIECVIPKTVDTIGIYILGRCTNLLNVIVAEDNPYYVSIDGALYNKDVTVMYQYPNGRTDTHFTVPNTVKIIEQGVFQKNSYLTNITIPKSVTNIEKAAIHNCSSLTYLIFEDHEQWWEEPWFFWGHDISLSLLDQHILLTELDDPEKAAQIFTTTTDYFYKTNYNLPANCAHTDLNSDTYCDNCKAPFNDLYSNHAHLLENGVCTVCELPESSAGLEFKLNENGNSYTLVGLGTCTESNIVVGTYNSLNVTHIDAYAFALCNTVTTVTLSETVECIGDFAFYKCTSIKSINIPASVYYIGENAFRCCSNLSNATIAENNQLSHIKTGVFANTNIQDINLPESVTIIDDYSFAYCDITSIVIPFDVDSIGDYVFYKCEGLDYVYYEGTSDDWENISIATDNEDLTNATIYYYSETQPTIDGNFWHYVDGAVVVW